MLSVAVCDDEILDCCHMARDVKAAFERIGKPFILREFGSGEELLQAAEHFDIILLDIMMDGTNGMEAARLLRDRASDQIIIFISIPFASLKAQNAMKKVGCPEFLFYNYFHRDIRYTTNHGEVSGLSVFSDDRIFICVGCFFKHK